MTYQWPDYMHCIFHFSYTHTHTPTVHTQSSRMPAVSHRYFVRIRLCDFSDSHTLPACPSPLPQQIHSIFPSLFTLFCLSIPLCLSFHIPPYPRWIESIPTLSIESFVYLGADFTICCYIIKTYFGLDVSLTVMLPRREIYCQWAKQTWTHTACQ